MTRLAVVAWCTLLWLLLWRDVSAANVLAGIAVGIVVGALPTIGWAVVDRPAHRVRPLALARLLGHVAAELFRSNLVLAREVLTPTNSIRAGVLAVALPGCSPLVTTIVANAVSLTPGTLSLDVIADPEPVLYVHVLHLHDEEGARAEIRTLRRLTEAALPERDRREATS